MKSVSRTASHPSKIKTWATWLVLTSFWLLAIVSGAVMFLFEALLT
jgi:hypothetical protein